MKFTPGGSYTSGKIVVSKLSSTGRNIVDYKFIKDRSNNWFWAKGTSVTKIPENTEFLDPREGVSVGGADGLSLTADGEVSTADRKIDLRGGLTFSGNFTAAKLDLTKIVPGGAYTSGKIVISRLSSTGRNIQDFKFIKDRSNNWFWAEGTSVKAITEGQIFFEPGEGFSVGGADGLSITIPGPTLN